MADPNGVSVARQLQDFIQKENILPGQRLPTHPELCQKLNVGLRRLREALSILSQQGLVETRRRGGTIVKSPSVKVLSEPIAWQLEEKGYTFEDMVRARAAIESGIAEEAAKSRTAEDLLKMLVTVEKMLSSNKASKELDDADEQFHLAILTAAHNPVIEIFGQLIVEQFNHKSKANLYATDNEFEKSNALHQAIYHSIEKGNAEMARKLVYEHIMAQIK
ncbi:FadR/GntR family transcriptional regulator [Planctomycetota bacterium]